MGSVFLLGKLIGGTDSERRIHDQLDCAPLDGNQVCLSQQAVRFIRRLACGLRRRLSSVSILRWCWCWRRLFFRPLALTNRSKLEKSKWRNSWVGHCILVLLFPPIIFRVAFGNLLQGVRWNLTILAFKRTPVLSLAWLNPFGILLLVWFSLMMLWHSGVWLQMKTDAELHRKASWQTASKTGKLWQRFLFHCRLAFYGWLYGIDGYGFYQCLLWNKRPWHPWWKTAEVQPGAMV